MVSLTFRKKTVIIQQGVINNIFTRPGRLPFYLSKTHKVKIKKISSECSETLWYIQLHYGVGIGFQELLKHILNGLMVYYQDCECREYFNNMSAKTVKIFKFVCKQKAELSSGRMPAC